MFPAVRLNTRNRRIAVSSCVKALAGITITALASELGAQTVQLPTFHQFGVSTSVLVPDRGTMVLGGVGRAADDAYHFGPALPGPLERRRRSGRFAASGTTRVWIHDFDALDARVRAVERGQPASSATQQRAAEIRQRWRELRNRPRN